MIIGRYPGTDPLDPRSRPGNKNIIIIIYTLESGAGLRTEYMLVTSRAPVAVDAWRDADTHRQDDSDDHDAIPGASIDMRGESQFSVCTPFVRSTPYGTAA